MTDHLNTQKNPFIINIHSKWSAEALEGLKSFIESEIRDKDEFDKLDNPLGPS